MGLLSLFKIMIINFHRLHQLLKLFLYLFIKYPKDISFYFDWISSLKNRRGTLTDSRPWLTFRAIKWLNSYLKPEMKVFEYGTGGSTVFFAKRVKSLISVEHDENWYRFVSDLLERMQISNIIYVLSKPTELLKLKRSVADPNSYTSGFKEYHGLDFSGYVQIIDKYPDKSFDLILIDGRARPACIKHAIKKLKKKGVVILDNADRERYNLAKMRYLSKFESKRFFGIGPYNTIPWETAIYFKSSNL